MKKHFWAIWQRRGVMLDSNNRPLVFSRLVDAKCWLLCNTDAHAQIVKCHIQEEES